MAEVAVIGAGCSGLAALKALRDEGVAVRCFERGSDVGGLWRYENDNGLSGAYASLRTNASRMRMQYPSFSMPTAYGDFPSRVDMAAYLAAYADRFGLREAISFRTTVQRVEPLPSGHWCIVLDDGSTHSFRDVVIATGVFWCPKVPEYPGTFAGHVSHSHDYRTPESFAGCRVLVVGARQSAAEIAVEVAPVAARTFMSVRSGAHVIPRWIAGKPYDASDVSPLNRMPWRLMNLVFGLRVARERGAYPTSWPSPAHHLLEGIPLISSDILPAVRRGQVIVKPAISSLAGDRVRFTDGTEEVVDRIVYATGYRISVPFLAPSLLAPLGRDLPLYRRIMPPGLFGLYFVGYVDAPGGLLPVVESQAEWLAAVVTGRLAVPPPEQMRQAIDRPEPRTRERFPGESPHSIRCDPHAYRRVLRSDLRRSQRAGSERRLTIRGAASIARLANVVDVWSGDIEPSG
jgi:dimethylaniline monooxygenase (N-oxide forming)